MVRCHNNSRALCRLKLQKRIPAVPAHFFAGSFAKLFSFYNEGQGIAPGKLPYEPRVRRRVVTDAMIKVRHSNTRVLPLCYHIQQNDRIDSSAYRQKYFFFHLFSIQGFAIFTVNILSLLTYLGDIFFKDCCIKIIVV
jgi:hypothetical protein